MLKSCYKNKKMLDKALPYIYNSKETLKIEGGEKD